ncbi:hypothetical protein BO85DRAFT_488794 [Aspergillus piperis CBS 112811]|uniref:NADH dehydrogenase [ubiquinone] 1 alpha subcomplex subunit 1 n=1 Tax=Aspergillus piperis CBS 112811 TaxID=1448313 RepID=A0A8G1QZK3_9EURO|nr:hypothetical protein BO85DRAFT_488794 [Aspergillus piperis CBS 112811]RAH57311.1 hypothetical protein BO85DRAFT_488794 [Aspergillus piperis CBS 112811]
MGVPFEALLPFGIIIGSFTVGGAGLWAVRKWDNEGKMPRWNKDKWDRQSIELTTDSPRLPVMERDLRITGTKRGQSSNHEAPKGFELSNPWKIEKRIF